MVQLIIDFIKDKPWLLPIIAIVIFIVISLVVEKIASRK